MALEIIPLEINGKVINKVVEDDTTIFTFLFYNKDGINITPARTIYTDEEEQIPELSTQIAYGVYIEPYYENGEYIFTFEYLNNVYKGIVSESDYENLTANSILEFYNSTVDGRLLPKVTNADNGKTLKVVNGEWTVVDMSPLVVTYTISGQPTGNTYPLSSSHTLAQIAEAYSAGQEVLAQIDFAGYVITREFDVRTASNGSLSVALIGLISEAPVLGILNHYFIPDDQEYANLIVVPLSTAQMSFDSSTNTLAITQ